MKNNSNPYVIGFTLCIVLFFFLMYPSVLSILHIKNGVKAAVCSSATHHSVAVWTPDGTLRDSNLHDYDDLGRVTHLGNQGIRLEAGVVNYGFVSSEGPMHITQNTYYDSDADRWKNIGYGSAGGFHTQLNQNGEDNKYFRVIGDSQERDSDEITNLQEYFSVREDRTMANSIEIGPIETVESGTSPSILMYAEAVQPTNGQRAEIIAAGGSNRLRLIQNLNTSRGRFVWNFVDNGVTNNVLYITDDGYIGGSFTLGSSDRRLKKDIEPITGAREIVSSLEGKTFTMRKTGDASSGLVAQEVEAILPHLVHIDEETGYKSLYYDGFIPYLIEGLKETILETETTESKVEQLEKKLQQQEELILELSTKIKELQQDTDE